MRRRSFVLHRRLAAIVDRRDVTVLEQDLAPKREFVLMLTMTPVQRLLYRTLLTSLAALPPGSSLLLRAYQALLRLWNHPGCLAVHSHLVRSRLEPRGVCRPLSWQQACRDLAPVAAAGNALRPGQSLGLVQHIRELDEKLFNRSKRKGGPSSAGDSDDSSLADEDGKDGGADKRADNSVSMVCDADEEVEVAGASGLDSSSLVVDDDCVVLDLGGGTSSSEAVIAQTSPDLAPLTKPHPPAPVPASTVRPLATPFTLSRTSSKTGAPLKASAASQSAVHLTEDEEEGPAGPLLDAQWWRKIGDAQSSTGGSLSSSDMLALSNKTVAFLHLLAAAVNNGEKMLLFSQSVSNLNFIELVLTETNWGELLGISAGTSVRLQRWRRNAHYMRMDGSTQQRQPLIDDFNSCAGCRLFLISTKAGNMGINLQSASRVVLFDSSWNPTHDLQAIFRCYRYGQQRPVFVYRLLAAGSMEEKIYKKQVAKQALAARVVCPCR